MVKYDFDYDRPVDRNAINQSEYEGLFSSIHSWLDSQSRDPLEYGKFLLNPTSFAYLHQQVNGQRLKYYPYQDLIANDPHRFKYFRAANQIGKSLLLDSLAARNLIWDHGHAHNESIVSKSLPQSTFQMRRVKNILKTMPEIAWSELKGSTDSLSLISVDIKDQAGITKYTNFLICAPCTEGLLGYDLHSLNLDEFEFWEVDQKYFFNQIAQPRTYHTKGKITIFSNPNGMDNYGTILENQTLRSGRKKWHVYVFNYLDKPGNTIEEYDELKHELSRAEFESTVDAVRTMSDRNFFTHNEIVDSESADLSEANMGGRQCFFFLDVGYVVDQSCLVGGYVETKTGYNPNATLEQNRPYMELFIPIVHLYPRGYPLSRVIGSPSPDQDNDGWHHEKSVREYLNEWKIGGVQPTFGFDATGNKGMIPLFESLSIQFHDIIFSGPEKSAFYTRFKYMMEKRLLHHAKSEPWTAQAKNCIATKSVRGYWLINAKNKSGEGGSQKEPDDTLDATSGLIAIADPQSVEETLRII
jgi:hypothetical protein